MVITIIIIVFIDGRPSFPVPFFPENPRAFFHPLVCYCHSIKKIDNTQPRQTQTLRARKREGEERNLWPYIVKIATTTSPEEGSEKRESDF